MPQTIYILIIPPPPKKNYWLAHCWNSSNSLGYLNKIRIPSHRFYSISPSLSNSLFFSFPDAKNSTGIRVFSTRIKHRKYWNLLLHHRSVFGKNFVSSQCLFFFNNLCCIQGCTFSPTGIDNPLTPARDGVVLTITCNTDKGQKSRWSVPLHHPLNVKLHHLSFTLPIPIIIKRIQDCSSE